MRDHSVQRRYQKFCAFIDRLIIRKKATEIVFILLTLKHLIVGGQPIYSREDINYSIQVAEFYLLLESRPELRGIDIGEVGLE